jgi:hypothetical protein
MASNMHACAHCILVPRVLCWYTMRSQRLARLMSVSSTGVTKRVLATNNDAPNQTKCMQCNSADCPSQPTTPSPASRSNSSACRFMPTRSHNLAQGQSCGLPPAGSCCSAHSCLRRRAPDLASAPAVAVALLPPPAGGGLGGGGDGEGGGEEGGGEEGVLAVPAVPPVPPLPPPPAPAAALAPAWVVATPPAPPAPVPAVPAVPAVPPVTGLPAGSL